MEETQETMKDVVLRACGRNRAAFKEMKKAVDAEGFRIISGALDSEDDHNALRCLVAAMPHVIAAAETCRKEVHACRVVQEDPRSTKDSRDAAALIELLILDVVNDRVEG